MTKQSKSQDERPPTIRILFHSTLLVAVPHALLATVGPALCEGPVFLGVATLFWWFFVVGAQLGEYEDAWARAFATGREIGHWEGYERARDDADDPPTRKAGDRRPTA